MEPVIEFDAAQQYILAKAWWEEVYKDCPTEYPSFIEDRPLILWLRGQLK